MEKIVISLDQKTICAHCNGGKRAEVQLRWWRRIWDPNVFSNILQQTVVYHLPKAANTCAWICCCTCHCRLIHPLLQFCSFILYSISSLLWNNSFSAKCSFQHPGHDNALFRCSQSSRSTFSFSRNKDVVILTNLSSVLAEFKGKAKANLAK